jgi:AcrR family transcriptional regulator
MDVDPVKQAWKPAIQVPNDLDRSGEHDQRPELIAAAMRLFGQQGYEQTTVAEITSTAGVSTKTFFNYFASKDEVELPPNG